jgi:hypothetical protein
MEQRVAASWSGNRRRLAQRKAESVTDLVVYDGAPPGVTSGPKPCGNRALRTANQLPKADAALGRVPCRRDQSFSAGRCGAWGPLRSNPGWTRQIACCGHQWVGASRLLERMRQEGAGAAEQGAVLQRLPGLTPQELGVVSGQRLDHPRGPRDHPRRRIASAMRRPTGVDGRGAGTLRYHG